MWNNQPSVSLRRMVLGGAGVITYSSCKMLRGFHLVNSIWFLYTWGFFLFLPLTILWFSEIYSVVWTALHSTKQNKETDSQFQATNESLSLQCYFFFCASLDEIEIIKGMVSSNLLVELTVSPSLRSNGFHWLYTIIMKSLVLVLTVSFRNEVPSLRLISSRSVC